MKILDLIRSANAFSIVEETSLYNPALVQKIKSQEGQPSVAIKTEDLWK
jgi:hypothetical protein